MSCLFNLHNGVTFARSNSYFETFTRCMIARTTYLRERKAGAITLSSTDMKPDCDAAAINRPLIMTNALLARWTPRIQMYRD